MFQVAEYLKTGEILLQFSLESSSQIIQSFRVGRPFTARDLACATQTNHKRSGYGSGPHSMFLRPPRKEWFHTQP